ncbi:acetyltransferase-like isoleucine patch superfamily enzyme [Roseovarius sp. MBR-78]|jgi:acetyltransferase-like isoleucine patch superfamily enzyme|uniref:acyltransferase n=1 Tax=Roseovarius sp. MBR-78 TaxID=3156460 RepID=UPI003399329E
MKPAFDEAFFKHINDARNAETGHASTLLTVIEKWLSKPFIKIPLAVFERILTIILTLPIPVYSTLVYMFVNNIPGLPSFSGVYLRALYYRGRIGTMESNVMIEQGVFIAFPKNVVLKEFCFLDKNVIIMAKSAQVGRRVHIAPNVFVSGGGDFIARDYSCIATGSQLITSTEVLKGGARCSGPMVSADQRNVLRGKVELMEDVFVGANATILTNVTLAQGSVVGAGVTIAKDTEAWGIYVNDKPRLVGHREAVRHENN